MGLTCAGEVQRGSGQGRSAHRPNPRFPPVQSRADERDHNPRVVDVGHQERIKGAELRMGERGPTGSHHGSRGGGWGLGECSAPGAWAETHYSVPHPLGT